MERITTPFGFDSTALDVVADVDLTGRSAIVTGASSGLGVETARALLVAGADVTLAVRDLEAGRAASDELGASTGREPKVAWLDLIDLASVAALAREWVGPLHVLVNNAGVMATPETRTEQGWEWQLATNHLGHFALTTALHDALATEGARVVTVSSSGHQRSPVVWDDLHFDFRPYDPWLAYGQSKTANVLMGVEASRRWRDDGITANAVMPGAIHTNLQRHMGGRGSGTVPAELLKTPAQGAATTVLAATSPLLDDVGGRYFADCAEAEVLDRRSDVPLQGVARYALDPENAERLWTTSQALLTGGRA